jgi:transposase InsO family protein
VLEDLLVRYRRVWRRRYVQRGFRLSWHQAGSVWAMDHSQALHPIDGIYPYLLAVRDLASGYQLAWHPTRTVTAEETLPILLSLFDEQGVPLVLKSDNGSAFTAEDLRHVIKQQNVVQLFSPPRRPAYNGALERSNGVLKTYTHQHALAEGHPFRWTSDDLEHARQLANTISRPWGHRGPTPEEAWQSREPIGAEQREEFRAALLHHRAQANRDLGLDEQQPMSVSDMARRDRLALGRVLEELGYLTKQRVRRPPKKPKRMARDELARRTQEYEREHDHVVRFGAQRLAALVTRDRISGSTARKKDLVDSQHAPQQTASTHRERTNSSWSRRLITLLISLAKAAKITR